MDIRTMVEVGLVLIVAPCLDHLVGGTSATSFTVGMGAGIWVMALWLR